MVHLDQWHWQEQGTSWKGIGIYHLTLTVSSREPLLGKLVVPDNDPSQARVEPSEMGRLLLECHRSVPTFTPEIQILQYCLMPDHLHSIWYVRQPMEHSIRYVAQGFWRAAKKIGRAYSYINARLKGGSINESRSLSLLAPADKALHLPYIAPAVEGLSLSSLAPADSRENPLRQMLDVNEYISLAPVFTEVPCPPFP